MYKKGWFLWGNIFIQNIFFLFNYNGLLTSLIYYLEQFLAYPLRIVESMANRNQKTRKEMTARNAGNWVVMLSLL